MSTKWVTFFLGHDVFGVEIKYVREMVAQLPTRVVPRQPAEQIGVAILRNEIVPVMDFRKVLGMPGEHLSKELIATLEGRKQDHINWLRELEACVNEGREFGLSLDPTKCKFGKWLATFQTDDPKLRVLLQRAHSPHDRIHALGHEVIALIKEHRQAEAIKKINDHRSTILASLLVLFEEAIQQVRDSARQVYVVLQGDCGPLGLCVDSLSSVVQIADNEVQFPEDVAELAKFKALSGYWTNPQTGVITRLLDIRQLYPALAAEETAATS